MQCRSAALGMKKLLLSNHIILPDADVFDVRRLLSQRRGKCLTRHQNSGRTTEVGDLARCARNDFSRAVIHLFVVLVELPYHTIAIASSLSIALPNFWVYLYLTLD